MNLASQDAPLSIKDPFFFARRLHTAIWVYDTDNAKIIYANNAACKLWDAEGESELTARNLSEGMSTTVADRLKQYQADFIDHDAVFNETWTIHPNDVPVTLNVVYRGFPLEDGRMAMMCEVLGLSEQSTETLRSTKALLHTDVVIALFGIKGQSLYKNPAARSILPNDAKALEHIFIHPEDFEKAKMTWENEGESRCITKIKTSDGESWVDLSIKKCLDAVTSEQALLVTAFDVNELKVTGKALLDAKETAESANRAKSEFLATMSHEIRTPMNGVIGMVDVLQKTELSEKQRQFTKIIHQSGHNLMAIINDILDFSKIEANKLSIDSKACDLEETIDYVVNLLRPRAREKTLDLEFHYDADLPRQLMIDDHRIRQILTNLIGNAIKFTHQGAITVNVSGEVRDDIAHLNIAVKDTGIGIEASKLDLVFEKFTQAESSTTRRYGGTGLGLAISKGLAEAMKGDLKVSSNLGQGTIFTLHLPLKVVSHTTPKTNPSQQAVKTNGNPKLNMLMVGTDPQNKALLTNFLKHPKINIVFSDNTAAAVKACQMTPFNMILIDVKTPIMDDMTTIKSIRQHEKARRTKPSHIICLATQNLIDERQTSAQSGIDDYLAKPLQKNELYALISNHLKASKRLAGNPQDVTSLTA